MVLFRFLGKFCTCFQNSKFQELWTYNSQLTTVKLLYPPGNTLKLWNFAHLSWVSFLTFLPFLNLGQLTRENHRWSFTIRDFFFKLNPSQQHNINANRKTKKVNPHLVANWINPKTCQKITTPIVFILFFCCC